MNELLFFIQIILVLSFLFFALRLGKTALIVFVVLQAIFANLFVLKQIVLFGFCVTCSDVYAIGGVLGLNFIQEWFGKKQAKKALYFCFFFMLFFMVLSQVHLLFSPAELDATQSSYLTIFSNVPRIIIASFSVFFLIDRFDIFFYSKLKKWTRSNALIQRIGISMIVSQFFDTVLFSFLGLYGLVDKIFDIILVSFLVKISIIATQSFFLLLSRKILKNITKVYEPI